MILGMLFLFAALQETPAETGDPVLEEPTQVENSEAPAPPESAPVDAPRIPLDHALDDVEIAAALDELAQLAGDLGAMETIGTSAGGRAIRVLTLTVPDGLGDESDARSIGQDKPGVLAVGYGEADRAFGAEAVLAFGRLLLDNANAEPYSSFLSGKVIMLAPALDPDARAPKSDDGSVKESVSSAARRPVFDRNFPLGWMPGSLRAGAGDIPLSMPESMSAVRWLDRTENLVMIIGAADRLASQSKKMDADIAQGLPANLPWPGASLPPSDATVYADLVKAHAGGVELLPWNDLASQGGGFFDYAYQARGIYPLAWTRPPAGADAQGLLAWCDEVASRTVALLFSLPDVRIDLEELAELAPGYWRLDVAMRNGGSIPTLSALGENRLGSGGLTLTISGAKLIATARRATATGTFQLDQFRTAGASDSLGGHLLGGGETHWLRLILEGERGSTIELMATSVRAGSARLSRVLE